MNATLVNARIRFLYGLDGERCTNFICSKLEIGQEILLRIEREFAATVEWLPTGRLDKETYERQGRLLDRNSSANASPGSRDIIAVDQVKNFCLQSTQLSPSHLISLPVNRNDRSSWPGERLPFVLERPVSANARLLSASPRVILRVHPQLGSINLRYAVFILERVSLLVFHGLDQGIHNSRQLAMLGLKLVFLIDAEWLGGVSLGGKPCQQIAGRLRLATHRQAIQS